MMSKSLSVAEMRRARAQSSSRAARRSRRRRKHLMEGSFAQSSNRRHFKRARWRRLWRQRIQDYLIAAVQNIGILIKHKPKSQTGAATGVRRPTSGAIHPLLHALLSVAGLAERIHRTTIPAWSVS